MSGKDDDERPFSRVMEVTPRGGKEVIQTIRHDSENGKSVGGLAFFIGINEPNEVRASEEGDLKLLTLSREDYEELSTNYPEQHDIICSNILHRLGLGRMGDARCSLFTLFQ